MKPNYTTRVPVDHDFKLIGVAFTGPPDCQSHFIMDISSSKFIYRIVYSSSNRSRTSVSFDWVGFYNLKKPSRFIRFKGIFHEHFINGPIFYTSDVSKSAFKGILFSWFRHFFSKVNHNDIEKDSLTKEMALIIGAMK